MELDPEVIKRSTEEQLEHIMRMNEVSQYTNKETETYVASMDVSALFVEIKPDCTKAYVNPHGHMTAVQLKWENTYQQTGQGTK